MIFFSSATVFNLTIHLTGWTIWLFCFTPVLVSRHGPTWEMKVTSEGLQSFAAMLRMSFIIILGQLYYYTYFIVVAVIILEHIIFSLVKLVDNDYLY